MLVVLSQVGSERGVVTPQTDPMLHYRARGSRFNPGNRAQSIREYLYVAQQSSALSYRLFSLFQPDWRFFGRESTNNSHQNEPNTNGKRLRFFYCETTATQPHKPQMQVFPTNVQISQIQKKALSLPAGSIDTSMLCDNPTTATRSTRIQNEAEGIRNKIQQEACIKLHNPTCPKHIAEQIHNRNQGSGLSTGDGDPAVV